MGEQLSDAVRFGSSPLDQGRIGRIISALAAGVALLGGLALMVAICTVALSVAGRSLIRFGLSPIRGDYEIVAMTVAFALFAFLPWAHLKRGHAVVGIFTDKMGVRINALLQLISDVLMLLLALFIAWRHTLGTLDKFAYGETTLLLRFPLSWAYSACLLGAYAFALIAVYVLIRTIHDIFMADAAAQNLTGAPR